jgi:Xaa-Pro dipeptidase
VPTLNDYQDHLRILEQRYTAALEQAGFDAVLLGAGIVEMHFLDDQSPAFRPNPMLTQWLPLLNHPGALLLFRPGSDALVVVVSDDDYWHLPPQVPPSPWRDALEIRVAADHRAALAALGELPPHTALLGPAAQWEALEVAGERNPSSLIDALHYQRSIKTGYEIELMREATALGVAGHRAAREAFGNGGSEFDILLAFLDASRQHSDDLPYPAIVAADEHAAVLHYQFYERRHAPAASLLIDAGCASCGYASDITRTYAMDGRPEFAALIDALDRLQQTLCEQVRPGLKFAELQDEAHRGIAGLLADHRLIDADPGEIVSSGATQCFFPHGLGHLLGAQVHDVGGDLADMAGTRLNAPASYPRLRLLRELQADQVLTIEPGLYFIDSLLEKLRAGKLGARVDWSLIERLRPCGGIRIEDNLRITGTGAENLTRQAFAA